MREATTGRELSYAALWDRSARLTEALRALGVGRGDVVGLDLDRSIDLVVGMLAILRTGAAYLAVDAHAPQSRRAEMLEDADVDVMVCADGSLADRSEPAARSRTGRRSASRRVGENGAAGEDTPAYVAFTSGSTGRPKGVVIPHRGVVGLATSADYCPIAPGDRVANSSNPAFDATTFEVWSTLSAGGTVVVLPTLTDLPLDLWVELIEAESITTMFLTTSLFTMVAAERPSAFRPIRTLIVGGEQLDLTAARRVLSVAPSTRLLNAYGPTETTTFATTFECAPGTLADLDRVPIGYALPDTRLYVLDHDLRRLGVGEEGELGIGGSGVALGYLHRPELTTERFLAEESVGGPHGGFVYRTGDRVRTLPSGAIELLGRRDRQIKLRGFRIELEEIERAAVDTGLVAAAFVEKQGTGPSAQLVGYLLPPVSSGRPSDLAAAVATGLSERLPAYMLPARWELLAELPVGPTGKTDRTSLAAHLVASDAIPAGLVTRPAAGHIGLAEIWREVLGVTGAANGSFLALGGNSILAVQLVARARGRLGIELLPRQVLRAGSVAELIASTDSPRKSLQVVGGTEHSDQRTAPGDRADPLDPAHRLYADHPAPANSAGSPVVGTPIHEVPLTGTQEQLLVADQVAPEAAAYNVPVVVRLRGRLNEAALQRALTIVVGRHQALHSVVATVDGRPVLRADPAFGIELRRHHLDPEADVMARLSTLTAVPFDLIAGPLVRADLLTLGPDEHLLALTIHHLVVDGASITVLIRELGACYATRSEERLSALPPAALPPNPAEVREHAPDHTDTASHVDYWQTRLRGVPPLELPTDGPAERGGAGPGLGVAFRLPHAVAEQVRRVSATLGLTTFATLLAAFQALLARLTGAEDFGVAVPMAGRLSPEAENVVGFFVNTVVVRAELAGDPSFEALAQRTQDSLLDGLAHQQAPVDEVIGALGLPRTPGRHPLAQVIIGARDPLPDLGLPDLSIERYEWGQGSAGFDLALELEVSTDGIGGRAAFPAGLFDESTVRGLLDRYQLLLAAAVADPAALISDLPLETDGERRCQFALGTGPRVPLPNRALPALISELATERPTSIALISSAHGHPAGLDRGRLDDWADDIATRLAADGIRVGAVVAVLLPRGPALIAAILGILRAGAAYLPLDPAQPSQRLAVMLADAGAQLVLTDAEHQGRLDRLSPQSAVVALTGQSAARLRPPTPTPVPGPHPEQRAYVIFTSGSTGRPKPVAVPHRALLNHALATRALFDLQPDDRVLQSASAGFDVFAEEVFPTLLAGARVVFPNVDDPAHVSVAELDATMRAQAISVVNLPSGVWGQWARELIAERRQPPPSLRLVVIGSEPADGRLLEQWRERIGVPVANLYGVSEATVSSTALSPAHATRYGTVPIGRPLANTDALVLDPSLQAVPGGVVGELYLGGAGLAHGYLGRPDLTAERFVPNPYGPPGSRLYRTGDLSRRLPDGELDHRGRADDQLKIRGIRVEPGEVESRLVEHPDIDQAAVAARPDVDGGQLLVGYLVCPGAAPELELLRTFLSSRLPATMVPSVFVLLDRLPLTVSGKLDRNALPAIGPDRLQSTRPHRAASSATEVGLAELWTELLGVTGVGVDDDFFGLGGHSLLASQLVARIRERLQLELPLRWVFDHPTIAALAHQLDTCPTPARASTAPRPVLGRATRDRYRIAADRLDHESHQSPLARGKDHVA